MIKKFIVLFFTSVALIAISINSVFAEEEYVVYNVNPQPIRFYQDGESANAVTLEKNENSGTPRTLKKGKAVVIRFMKLNSSGTLEKGPWCQYGKINFGDNSIVYLKPIVDDDFKDPGCRLNNLTFIKP
ncbi:MAG: hypothetical protein AABY34_05065 [Pseudomonadota bacterium]